VVVKVTHALGSYPVYIEPGSLGTLDHLVQQHLGARRVAMIADAAVHDLYREGRLGAAPSPIEAITFPSGERSKSREWWASLTDALLERGFGRDCGIIALGGGVAGDLAGFVAATFMRGVPYLQVPTTLLAMLDASVGGKTAVDTPQGKNLVGAFHPPVAVLADPATLRTLPEREYRAGLAEAVKHGVIADRSYFDWIEQSADALLGRDEAALVRLVSRSVEIKAQVVGEDEREGGRRAILNAGHTVAHALEQALDFGIPHGEAVALGLVAECALAEALGLAESGLHQRVEGLLHRLGLPSRLQRRVAVTQVIAAMSSDKKNRDSRIRFALPTALGAMASTGGWTRNVDEPAIRSALAHIL
jgi:3-dehydroquinate synthase